MGGGRFSRRKTKVRDERKLMVIVTEGAKTEPAYFNLFKADEFAVIVKYLNTRDKSAPSHLLRKMKAHLKQNDLRKTDEAWFVVDKDLWSDESLGQLLAWSASKPNYGLAVSNPCFEYWLLLHFEIGKGVTDAKSCLKRLEKHVPNYRKGNVDPTVYESKLRDGVANGKKRDTPPVSDWPKKVGTTVYRLVERMLPTEEGNS